MISQARKFVACSRVTPGITSALVRIDGRRDHDEDPLHDGITSASPP